MSVCMRARAYVELLFYAYAHARVCRSFIVAVVSGDTQVLTRARVCARVCVCASACAFHIKRINSNKRSCYSTATLLLLLLLLLRAFSLSLFLCAGALYSAVIC